MQADFILPVASGLYTWDDVESATLHGLRIMNNAAVKVLKLKGGQVNGGA